MQSSGLAANSYDITYYSPLEACSASDPSCIQPRRDPSRGAPPRYHCCTKVRAVAVGSAGFLQAAATADGVSAVHPASQGRYKARQAPALLARRLGNARTSREASSIPSRMPVP